MVTGVRFLNILFKVAVTTFFSWGEEKTKLFPKKNWINAKRPSNISKLWVEQKLTVFISWLIHILRNDRQQRKKCHWLLSGWKRDPCIGKDVRRLILVSRCRQLKSFDLNFSFRTFFFHKTAHQSACNRFHCSAPLMLPHHFMIDH